jgi:hypothetical protein
MITFTEVTWYSKLAAVIFFLGVLPVLTFYIGMKYQEVISITAVTPYIPPSLVKGVSDFKNATFSIDGTSITLTNGVSEVVAPPGSASKTVTHYFGNEVYADLNNDGTDDAIFLVTQSGGGSGTFFYVVAALKTLNGYVGSKAFYIGDRIAPQSTTKGDGNTVVVNYADRKPEEGYAIAPSVGKSLQLRFDSKTLEFIE